MLAKHGLGYITTRMCTVHNHQHKDRTRNGSSRQRHRLRRAAAIGPIAIGPDPGHIIRHPYCHIYYMTGVGWNMHQIWPFRQFWHKWLIWHPRFVKSRYGITHDWCQYMCQNLRNENLCHLTTFDLVQRLEISKYWLSKFYFFEIPL